MPREPGGGARQAPRRWAWSVSRAQRPAAVRNVQPSYSGAAQDVPYDAEPRSLVRHSLWRLRAVARSSVNVRSVLSGVHARQPVPPGVGHFGLVAHADRQFVAQHGRIPVAADGQTATGRTPLSGWSAQKATNATVASWTASSGTEIPTVRSRAGQRRTPTSAPAAVPRSPAVPLRVRWRSTPAAVGPWAGTPIGSVQGVPEFLAGAGPAASGHDARGTARRWCSRSRAAARQILHMREGGNERPAVRFAQRGRPGPEPAGEIAGAGRLLAGGRSTAAVARSRAALPAETARRGQFHRLGDVVRDRPRRTAGPSAGLPVIRALPSSVPWSGRTRHSRDRPPRSRRIWSKPDEPRPPARWSGPDRW